MTHFFPGIRQFTRLAAALAAALLSGTAAHAGTDTSTLDVSATITAACAIGGGSLGFGDISPVLDSNTGQAQASSNKTAQADLSWACTQDTLASISVGNGNNPETVGLDQVRRMSAGSSMLRYYLYQDAGHNLPLSGVSVVGTGSTETLTVYSKTLGADIDQAPPGLYSDTVAVTITY